MNQQEKDYHHAKKAKGTHGEHIAPNRVLEQLQDEEYTFDHIENVPLSFQEIAITELLEQDSRPTFVLDLDVGPAQDESRMKAVYCNRSLRFFDELRRIVLAETFYPGKEGESLSLDHGLKDSEFKAEAEFKKWSMIPCGSDSSVDGYLPRHTFHDLCWTSATLRNRWRVISASRVPNQQRESHGTPKLSRDTSRSSSTARSSTESDSTLMLETPTLSQQLADSESKFRVLTELNPVGMYYLSPDGNILYANDMWYEITGHPRGLEGEMSFMNVISESSHPLIIKEWEILTTERGRRTFELKLRNPWFDESSGQMKQKWILASCDQEFDEEGNLKSIMGCITDISLLKHVEEDAIERANLVEKLALRTQEAAQHEKNFQQMAELAPCGMSTFDDKGTITWANSQWYEMTGHSRRPEEHYPMSFLDSIEPEDHESFHNNWRKLSEQKEEISSELRLKKPWIRNENNNAVRDTTWILFLALPQLDRDGNLATVFGCTTDISHFKWAELVQLNSRLQAEEAKRQQEAFIDMTSHEMRNPLGAIMLSVDGITQSLQKLKAQSAIDPSSAIMPGTEIDDNLEASQTVALCAQHQGRIIDDVLTLSKLDSAMLQVSPVNVQAERAVRKTLKMFDSEFQTHNIDMKFVVAEPYKELEVNWVYCDPFTRSESVRRITIYLSASTTRPPRDLAPNIQWFPSKDAQSIHDPTLTPEWGTGQQVYLYFAVEDTGRGLAEDEKTRLFRRFSQANHRTHIQYGGSGLGLFISRELTELQGGEIGVASSGGSGSTFAFYIKARRSVGPEANNPSSDQSSASTYKTTFSNSPSRPNSPPIHPVFEDGPSMAPQFPSRRAYHILLVEDNLINQKVLSKQLRNVGCTVHVANHGGEALDFLARSKLWKDPNNNGEARPSCMDLSIILMDLEMPVMDGLACSRAIKDFESEGRVDHVPIIAVTANARTEQMDRAIEAGMDDIVTKPFQIPELMEKVDRLLLNLSR